MLRDRGDVAENAILGDPDAATLAHMEPTFDDVWPKSARAVQARRAATRPVTLDGLRFAFLWDHVFRGDEVCPILERELRRRHPSIEVLGHEVFGNTHGSDEKRMLDRLPDALRDRGVDAVVSGMGC